MISFELSKISGNQEGNQFWVFIGRTDVEAETQILWPPCVKHWLIWKKKPWCWERLKMGGEGNDRGWDGWMASPTQWAWVWVNPGSWWWTGWPGVLRFMGSQRVGHDWATELNWIDRRPEFGGWFLGLSRMNRSQNGTSHSESKFSSEAYAISSSSRGWDVFLLIQTCPH